MFPVYDELARLFGDMPLSREQYEKFSVYAAMLAEWNERMNLTAITEGRAIAEKHFLDSALPLKLMDVPQNASVADIGTGAGFPGLPMKIMRGDIRLTLLDSLNKRLTFLSAVCEAADIEAELIHGRAEDFGRKAEYREVFDIVTARAVAAMPLLAEYCMPFVKPGGVFAALKGPGEDIKAAEGAITELGGEISGAIDYELPCGDRRMLICVRKIKQTSPRYPRSSKQLKKLIINN